MSSFMCVCGPSKVYIPSQPCVNCKAPVIIPSSLTHTSLVQATHSHRRPFELYNLIAQCSADERTRTWVPPLPLTRRRPTVDLLSTISSPRSSPWLEPSCSGCARSRPRSSGASTTSVFEGAMPTGLERLGSVSDVEPSVVFRRSE
jgi:hypothetical protein